MVNYDFVELDDLGRGKEMQVQNVLGAGIHEAGFKFRGWSVE